MKKLLILLGFLVNTYSNAQTKVVLIEQFTNSSCSICGQFNPGIYNYANNNTGITTLISYHTSFPYFNDSMYFENRVDADARVSYYNVLGVPYTIIDGNVARGSSSSLLTSLSTTVGNRSMVAADYEVSTVSLDLDAGLLTGSFVFTSLNSSNSTKNLVAHIVAIEADVLKSSYSASPGNNIETHYEYVMRKMIPDANGTILVNKTLNGMDTISFSLPLTNIKDMSQVRVVAFVQNNTNKEIGQAQLFIPQFGSVGINENVIEEVGATLFPNPSNGNFNLSFSDDEIVKEVSVYNQFGELVYSQKQNTLNKLVIVSANLSTGLYNVKISSGSKVAIKKITIIN